MKELQQFDTVWKERFGIEAFQINISTNKIDDYEVSYGFYRKPSQCEGFERNCTICICIGKETWALAITMRDLILGAPSSYQQVQSIPQNKKHKLNSDYEVS